MADQPHEQIAEKQLKNNCPHMLTSIEDSRPGNFILGMMFCAESGVQVEKYHFHHVSFKKIRLTIRVARARPAPHERSKCLANNYGCGAGTHRMALP